MLAGKLHFTANLAIKANSPLIKLMLERKIENAHIALHVSKRLKNFTASLD